MSNKEQKNFAKKRVTELYDELEDLMSTAIVNITEKNSFLKGYYEELDWDTELSYLIEEAVTKLGLGLATLETHKREGVDIDTEDE